MLTEVNYRTGFKRDMAGADPTGPRRRRAVIWDLAHSAGAFPVDLAGADADFAVGCGYKYLNGGPGAPAFAYVAPRLLSGLRQPLSGWLGHARPFAFAPDYEPARRHRRAARRHPADPVDVRARCGARAPSTASTLADLAARPMCCGTCLYPRWTAPRPELDPAHAARSGAARHAGLAPPSRGLCHHPGADRARRHRRLRQPDILRFGLTPLYLRYADVWKAAARSSATSWRARAWDTPEFKRKAKVV